MRFLLGLLKGYLMGITCLIVILRGDSNTERIGMVAGFLAGLSSICGLSHMFFRYIFGV